MEDLNLGGENEIILRNFRRLGKGYIDQLTVSKNDVYHLLGKKQAYSSGIFRESLIKNFLGRFLPKSVSVDSGFIYGFDQVNNSGQLDVILWDSLNFGAIHRSDEFVIVSPESVISVITIKSNLTKKDLIDGLNNLSSIIDLDLKYRFSHEDTNDTPIFKPIHKFFLSFTGTTKNQDTLGIVSEFYKDLLSKKTHYENELIKVLREINPQIHDKKYYNICDRIFVSMITSLEAKEKSFIRGIGPPEDISGNLTFKSGIKRVPFLYKHKNKITNQFEKFIYNILLSVYQYYGTNAFSILAGWSDMNPVWGMRDGDIAEINLSEGIELMNYK